MYRQSIIRPVPLNPDIWFEFDPCAFAAIARGLTQILDTTTFLDTHAQTSPLQCKPHASNGDVAPVTARTGGPEPGAGHGVITLRIFPGTSPQDRRGRARHDDHYPAREAQGRLARLEGESCLGGEA